VSKSHLAERFERVCRERTSVVAVRDLTGGTACTFGDLHEQYRTLRRTLLDVGVGRESLVVSLIGNRAIFFPMVAACLDVGATLLPLGETTASEALALIEQSGASAVVADRALPFVPARTVPLSAGIHLLGLETRAASLAEGEPSLLKLTSGSTELPRVAVAHEAHLVNDGRHVIDAMAISREDVNVGCIPLSHSYALGNIVVPLLWQGTSVALRQSFAPAQFLADAEATGATIFPGVPFMFERLAALPIESLPPTLRLLISAGAPIALSTLQWFSERLSRKIHSFYGSSETGGIAYDDTEAVGDRVHVGSPMPETTITIRGSGGNSGDGRIFVTGNAVTSGYAGAEPPDRAFVDDGFLSTDLGHLDGAGHLVLTGRVSSIVNVAGRKVDPGEVERVLRGFPEIHDARVLGTACDHRGQQLAAVVVRREPGLTAAGIRSRCATLLSAYKIPRRFVFLEEFPLTSRGKIDRRALEELVSQAPRVP
jgi:long-chain acyl-CoA synthetase